MQGKMVKLGNNFSEKNSGKAVSEDGFDTIPLITPLDASQLQFPPPDKVRFDLLVLYLEDSHCTGLHFCISAVPAPAQLFSNNANLISFLPLLTQLMEISHMPHMCHVFFYQVVVKTKADYDAEGKKGKLRSPKIAEFSISIIEGVSERLKVRIMTSSVFLIHFSHLPPTHLHAQRGRRSLGSSGHLSPSLLYTPPSRTHVIPAQTTFLSCVLCLPACLLTRATQGDIMHDDSLNPALNPSLIQLLPWRWPLNSSIPPTFPPLWPADAFNFSHHIE